MQHTTSERVAALRQSGLLNRSQQQDFGHLTDLVRDVLDVPVAIVTLVDEDRQVFAGHSGLPAPWDARGETPMTHSFCQHVVDRKATFVVPDARLEPLVVNNDAISDLGVVAYLGVPLALPEGDIVGALAAIDTQPRNWSADDERRLRSLARTVEKEMEVRISGSRWRVLFESMQEGFILGRVLRDRDGRIQDWRFDEVNAAWYDLMGMKPGTVIGRTARELLHGADDAWIQEFAAVVEGGRPVRFTRQLGDLGRWYDGVAQPAGTDRFTAILMDATDRIKRDRRQATLLTLGDELRERSDLKTVITAAAQCLADGLEVDRVGFGMVEGHDETVDVLVDWCEPGMPSIVGQHGFGSFGSHVHDGRSNEIVAIDDIRADPRTRDLLSNFERIRVGALIDLPIGYNGRPAAIVFAHSRDFHPWTEGELQFVRQVNDRVRVALVRQQAEEAQHVLTQEMAHRMKNTLAMVQAIVTQTLRQSANVEDGRNAISQRLVALGRAQDILTGSSFAEADAHAVVRAAMAPHQTQDQRITLSGPRVLLTSQQTLGLSLAIHELATNATKYGALSTGSGRVAVSWGRANGAFVLDWIETGGPPVSVPHGRGFGSRLIEQIIGSYFDGEGRIEFDPAGLRFKLVGTLGGAAPSH